MTKPKKLTVPEVAEVLNKNYTITISGSHMMYILNTLKEKAVGLMVKKAITGGDLLEDSSDEEKANSTVGAALLETLTQQFGEDFMESYLSGNVERLPDDELRKAVSEAGKKPGKHLH